MTRRRIQRILRGALLVLVFALAGCGAGAGEDRPDRAATLLLDFQPNGVHAGIYSAVRRGYDEAEGVQLTVRVPASGTDATRLLLAGRAQFAVLDLHDLALAREKGRDVVAVMALVQRPLAAVLAQPQIRSPRDLAGRRVGVTGLPSDDAVLRSIVPRPVRKVTIGFNAVSSLLAGRVDGATGFWNVEGVALRRRRPGARIFKVDDHGAPAYPELVLVTARRTLDEEPAVVRATVHALLRGYGVTLTDPASSVQDEVAANRGLDAAQLTEQVDVLDTAFLGASGRFGTLDLDALRKWARWEARFGIVRRPPDVTRMFDPAFVASAPG